METNVPNGFGVQEGRAAPGAPKPVSKYSRRAKQREWGSAKARERRTAEEWIDEYRRLGRNIWDRLPCETPRQYEYFCIYRDAGPTRSQKVLAGSKEYVDRLQGVPTTDHTRSNPTSVPKGINVYSTINCWVERARSFDKFLAEQIQEATGRHPDVEAAVAYTWEERQDRLREKQHQIAELVLKRAYETISSKDFKVPSHEVRAWIDWATGVDQRAIDPQVAEEIRGKEASIGKPRAARPKAQQKGGDNLIVAGALFEPEDHSDEDLWRIATGG